MFKHKQFDSNYLTKHIFFTKHIYGNTISGIVKPSFTIPEGSQNNGSLGEPASHGHSRPFSIPIHDQHHNTYFSHQISRGAATGCSIFLPKILSIRSHVLGPIKRPLTASNNRNIRKTLNNRNKTQVGRNPTSRSLKKLTKTGVHA